MKRHWLLAAAALLLVLGAQGASAQTPPFLINCVLPSTACIYPGQTVTNNGDPPYVWAGKDNENFTALFGIFGGSATGPLAATNFPGLTGPVTTTPGSLATHITATAVTPGSYGDGTHSGQFTVGADGRVTAAASVSITGVPLTGAAGGVLGGTYPNPGFGSSTGTGAVVEATSPVLATPAIAGSSTGTTTLASANASATNYTDTLPAATGTVALTSSNVATATALAATPSQCSGVQVATGVAASGNANCSNLPNPGASSLGGVQSLAPVTHDFLTGISILGVPTQAQPAFTDISGTATAAQIPNPTVSTIGGTESITCGSHTWISVISTSGVPSCTQPAFTDISGSVAASQMPALTGNCVTTAGAVAVTCPIQQNVQTISYTLLTGDAQFEIYHNSVSAHTFTIPANGSVPYVIGTCVMFTNSPTGGALTIAITTDTLYFFGDTGSRTIAAFGSAVACKKTSTTWYINGYGIS